MAQKREVHRGLGLTTPLTRGKDVEVLQAELNEQFKHFEVDRRILVDGELGPATMSAARQIAYAMGVTGKNRRKLRNGRITQHTQKLIREGREKSALERMLTVRRKPYRKKLRKQFDRTGGEKALAEAKRRNGVVEIPANSNWGGWVQKFIEFTGYTFPVYWCGCFVAWCVVKFGLARIETVIRLGFNEYIVADALAHRNGLVAVGFSEARAGDITVYTYPHIGLVDHLIDNDTIATQEGNTSAQGSGGSDSNGGGVYPRTRSRGEVRCIARPNYR
ncbi:MAG TPA: CHAP domain-containing protein [Solirubrobacterales bacterium]|nr:CHAP domain-containing protein [Solirubrobacterales bacterium]